VNSVSKSSPRKISPATIRIVTGETVKANKSPYFFSAGAAPPPGAGPPWDMSCGIWPCMLCMSVCIFFADASEPLDGDPESPPHPAKTPETKSKQAANELRVNFFIDTILAVKW
jgi:hypothetical protein